MTNELSNEETRRDRWISLPYVLMLMMVLIGALSYFLDDRVSGSRPSNNAAHAKADEFIKRRIAEHEQAAKQPAQAAAQTAVQKSVPQLTTRLTQPVKPDQASTFGGIFTRINWRGKLAYLKTKPRWIIGASLVAFLGLIFIARRRRKQDHLNFSGLLSDTQGPETEIKPEAAKQSVEESVPGIFSLYAPEETTDEGSFVATYLKPTISSFAESLRSIFHRQTEEKDRRYTLIPSVMRSMTTISASSQLQSTGNLFRRAVLTRKS